MQKILLTVFFSLAFLLGLNAQLTFSLVGPPVSCETNDFCVDVDVQDFTQVTGLEFAILWDTSEFDYVSHTFFLPGVPTANVSTTEGYLAFSWFGPFTGLTLPNDSTIIQMCLTRKANAGTVADIELGAQPGQGISISDLNNGILTQNVDFFFNSVQLTITDDEDPSITCPPDVTVFTSTPTGLGPVALSDNCGIRQVTYTLGGVTSGAGFDDVSGSTFVEGMTTVSYLAEDFGGRTDGCTFNVTYNDTTPLNPDILYFDPLIQQDCSAGTITVDFRVINFDSLISMQMGINWDTSIIEYIAHQNLELNPGTDPFNTALTPGGTLGLIWAQTPATSDGLSLADSTVIFRIEFNVKGTLGLPLFTYGNFGPLLFEISRFDNRRLTPSEYEFLPGTIEVSDTDAPIFSNCPTDITLSATPAACGSIYFWTAPTATDNCDTDLDITNNRNPGDFFDVGVDTVVYIVTDDAGLSDTCSFIVTVQDDTDPVVGCPIDLTVSVDPGNCSASVSGLAPTIAANCPTTTSYTITGATTATGSNDASGTVFQVGTSTVTYNVTESSGRMGSCSFTVTVEDNADPIINCPANIAQNADAGQCGAAVTIPAATATDDCGIQSITNDFNNTADASGTYPVGSTTVVWTATDVNGRTATCSMEIVITDATPPTVNCPADLTVDITSGNSSVVNGIDPVVSDACGVASTTYRLSTGATGNNTASGTSFGLGTTTVTYIATDVNGNVDSCQFGVTVRFVSNDILDCPVNVSTTTDAGQCSAVVTGIAPIINIDMADISTITFSLSQMGSSIGNGNDDASGTAFPNGTTTVEYIANDRFGNADTCTFTVSVTDDELPTWSNCPADVTVNADASCMGMATWAAPLASDNCGVVRIDSSNASGSSFGLGTSIITYVAFDAADNSATCTFRVTVEDNTPPTFDNCGANNLNLTYLPDCRAIATFDAITGTDNCSSAMVTCTHNPGDTLGEGTTRVVCLIVDMAGNTDRCEFDIEVRDTTPPIAVSCPPSVVVGVDEGRCSASVSWQLPVFSDNCSTPVLSSSHPSGFDFPVGNTTVTYTATDDSGNTATCTFAVTVNDDEPPVLVCDSVVVRIDGTVISDPGNIVLDATPDDNCQGVKVAYREPIGMDNCQGNVVATQTSSGPGNGDTFPEGETRIVYQVSDAAGNDAECTILVTVLPLSMIEVQFQPSDTLCEGSSVSMTINNPNTMLSYQWSGPNGFSSTDAEPTISELTPLNSGTYCVTITTSVQCTATDCGTLTVNPAPNFTLASNGPVCNTDLELTATLNDNSIGVDTWTWTFPDGQTDNSQNPVVPNPDISLSGTYQVVALGANGCSRTASIDVEVNNIPAPELTTDCDQVVCLGTECRLIGTEYLIVPDEYNWAASPAANSGLPANTDNNELSIIPTEPGVYVYNYWVSRGNCDSDTATLSLQVVETPIAVDDNYEVTYEQTLTNFNVLLNDTFSTAANLNFTVELLSDSTSNGTLEDLGGGVFNYTPRDGYLGIDQFVYRICYDCRGSRICDIAVVTLDVQFDGPCRVPNVISPNGDEFNDALIINCLEDGNFIDNEIIIYNQWGDKVFSQKPYQNDWRGTFEGENLPDGTYYYIFRVDPNADPMKGFIQILR